MHPYTSPGKLTPDVNTPVHPPRTGVNTASGIRGQGVEEDVVKVRIGVATRTSGACGGRLRASKLAAATQDEVAPGENARMTPRAADS